MTKRIYTLPQTKDKERLAARIFVEMLDGTPLPNFVKFVKNVITIEPTKKF